MIAPVRQAIREAVRAARRRHEPMGWRRELAMLIHSYVQRKRDGRPLSARTREETFDVLFMLFELLKKSGFKFQPRNLNPRHIEWLRRHYAARLADSTLQASTVHTYFAVLRRFCEETAHPGMVPPTAQLFPEIDTRRIAAAQTDRSWAGNGVSFVEVFHQVGAIEPFVAMALLAQCALGLRRREAVCLRPHTANLAAGTVDVVQGAKGGRHRTVVIETVMAREAIGILAHWVQMRDGCAGGSIGPQADTDPNASLARNLNRYRNVMTELGITRAGLGVTGHGLRAQFAIEFLERRGHAVSVRTGAEYPLSALGIPPDGRADQRADRAALSQQLGHSRISVTTAYTGRASKSDAGERGIVPDPAARRLPARQ